MSYDEWKQREPDPGDVRQAGGCQVDVLRCRDCHAVIDEGAHGTFDGVYCDRCWRDRSVRGWEFDPRTKAQLLATERKSA